MNRCSDLRWALCPDFTSKYQWFALAVRSPLFQFCNHISFKHRIEIFAKITFLFQIGGVNIENGSPSVSLGNYLQVLTVLHLEDDLLLIADKDPIGRQIQDAELVFKKRASKKKDLPSVIDYAIDKGDSENSQFE